MSTFDGDRLDLPARVFAGDSAMARLCREFDWARTPLGRVATWDPALRTSVTTLLSSPVAMGLTWGEDFVHVFNDAFRSAFGADGDDRRHLGRPVPEAWPSGWAGFGPALEAVMRGEPVPLVRDQPIRLERDGESGVSYWTSAHTPVRDRDGQIAGVLTVCRETTPEVTSLRAGEKAAEEQRAVFESITDAFFALDPEWRFTFVNGEAERVLQRARASLLGRGLLDAFPEAEDSPFHRAYARAMASGESQTFKAFYPPLDAWFEVKAYPSEKGLAVYFRDVSAEHAREETLREQAELLDLAHDAIVVRDLEHRITFWNRGAERLYGWSADEVEGRDCAELLYADPEAFERAHRRLLDEGEWSGEFEHGRRDGTAVTVESSWTLVRDDDGTPARVLSINTDVTERRLLMAQFLRAQRMQSIGTLAGGIAHDLNNVLTPVLMAVEMLRDAVSDDQALETLEVVASSAQRGADMVRQVLAYARGVDGTRVPVSVPEVASAVVRVIRDTFPRNITVVPHLDDPVPTIVGDPTQVHQLIMNLVVNARDAMPRGGRLTLAATAVSVDESFASMSGSPAPGRYVRLEVVDQGTGIAPGDLERIFEPFFTTKELGHGTGLGLSTVDAIVRSHGGFIHVYSELDAGTSVRAYLPVAGDGGATVVPPPPRQAPRGRGELILLVEDEEAVRTITGATLERLGYRVVSAADGAEAVALYGRRGEEIALVITDLMMPIMDGRATIRALRSIDPRVRIIAASGLGAERGAVRSGELEVDNFLPKPFDAETLATVVHEVLGTGAVEPPGDDGPGEPRES